MIVRLEIHKISLCLLASFVCVVLGGVKLRASCTLAKQCLLSHVPGTSAPLTRFIKLFEAGHDSAHKGLFRVLYWYTLSKTRES